MFHFSIYKKLCLIFSIVIFLQISQAFGAAKITDNIKILGVEYSFKSLAGISKEDLWKEFNTELKTFNQKEQKYLIFKVTGNREETDKEKCFDLLLSRMINRVKRVYILANLYDEIIGATGNDEEKLFNLGAIHRMYDAGTNIAQFVKDNQAKFKKPDEAEKTLQLLFKKYSLRNSQKIWRDNLKNRVSSFEPYFHVGFLSWPFKLRKYDKYKNADIKASLVHYLIVDYCKKGRYYKRAKHSLMIGGRVYESVKISAYQGNPAYISDMLLEVMNDDKIFIKSGMHSFNKWLGLTGIPVDLKFNLIPVNQDVNYSPKLGVIDQLENVYSINGIHPHSRDSKYTPDFIHRVSIDRAIQLCIADLLDKNLSLEKDSLIGFVSIPGINMIGLECKTEDFLKSNINPTAIELIIDNPGNLHNLASAAAIADLSSNRKLAIKTYKKCVDISKLFSSTKAKPYLNIAEALEKRFKDLKIDIKSLPAPDKINFETDSLVNPEVQSALKVARLASQKAAEIADDNVNKSGTSFWVMFIVGLVIYTIGVFMGRKMKKKSVVE